MQKNHRVNTSIVYSVFIIATSSTICPVSQLPFMLLLIHFLSIQLTISIKLKKKINKHILYFFIILTNNILNNWDKIELINVIQKIIHRD